MTSRSVLYAVMSLVLLHQLVAGVFGGGTILCMKSTGGVALQTINMTCCAVHGPQVTAAACCADDPRKICPTAPSTGCQGCTDYLVSMQPTLPPQAPDLALPQSAPVVIALIPWPSLTTKRVSSAVRRHGLERLPSPLRSLSTVVLRC